jgi:hypothetical protein
MEIIVEENAVVDCNGNEVAWCPVVRILCSPKEGLDMRKVKRIEEEAERILRKLNEART